MKLFPAIDLHNGHCVRLTKGDFKSATVYETDPLKQARAFAEAGASWLHVVDLDGARMGEVQQTEIVHEIAALGLMKVQVGGGIRSEAHIDSLLNAGVERVVIGSLAVTNPSLVGAWIDIFGPEKLVLALDVRKAAGTLYEIVTHGWQKGASVSLWDILAAYKNTGLKNILCTDIGRDGMLEGSNAELYSTIRQHWGDAQILASGGVNGMDDLRQLKMLGLAGAIVGKALYEGHVDLAEAIKEIEGP